MVRRVGGKVGQAGKKCLKRLAANLLNQKQEKTKKNLWKNVNSIKVQKKPFKAFFNERNGK